MEILSIEPGAKITISIEGHGHDLAIVTDIVHLHTTEEDEICAYLSHEDVGLLQSPNPLGWQSPWSSRLIYTTEAGGWRCIEWYGVDCDPMPVQVEVCA